MTQATSTPFGAFRGRGRGGGPTGLTGTGQSEAERGRFAEELLDRRHCESALQRQQLAKVRLLSPREEG